MDDLCVILKGRSEVLKRRCGGDVVPSNRGFLRIVEAMLVLVQAKMLYPSFYH